MEIGSQSTGLFVFVNELHQVQTSLTEISCNSIGGAYLDQRQKGQSQSVLLPGSESYMHTAAKGTTTAASLRSPRTGAA